MGTFQVTHVLLQYQMGRALSYLFYYASSL